MHTRGHWFATATEPEATARDGIALLRNARKRAGRATSVTPARFTVWFNDDGKWRIDRANLTCADADALADENRAAGYAARVEPHEDPAAPLDVERNARITGNGTAVTPYRGSHRTRPGEGGVPKLIEWELYFNGRDWTVHLNINGHPHAEWLKPHEVKAALQMAQPMPREAPATIQREINRLMRRPPPSQP